jgi:hypothetical protein
VRLRLALIHAADKGKLDCLECPDCLRRAVSVWFTHPKEDEYRTWFLCSTCTFKMRAHDLSRPEFYCEERVNEELEQYDAQILREAFFRRPKRD